MIDADGRRRAASGDPGPTAEAPDNIGPQERARLLGRYGRRFAAGETIFEEGTPAQEAFLLQEGRVRLFKRVAMTDRSLAVIKPGDLFGEGALLEGLAYGSTAVALTDGVVLALDRGTFRSLLAATPAGRDARRRSARSRLRDAEDQIEIMMLRGVQSKVTSALLKLAGRATGGAEVHVSPGGALDARRARRRGGQADRAAAARAAVHPDQRRAHRDPRRRRASAALHAPRHEGRARRAERPEHLNVRR